MNAREMIEQEMTADEARMQIDHKHGIDYRLIAAERVIERLQKRKEQLDRDALEDAKTIAALKQRVEELERARENYKMQVGWIQRFSIPAQERYRDRLDRYFQPMMPQIFQAALLAGNGKVDAVEIAAKCAAAIDAHLAGDGK